MKKLIAVIAAMMIMVLGCAASGEEFSVNEDDAVRIALDFAGLDKNQVSFPGVRQDWENGSQVWKVEFTGGGIEYEIEVDLKTGRIADADLDFIRSCDDWDYDLDSWSVLD